jgi:C4-dicarboxylate-specific signal transduction histidine kinase
MNRLHTHHVTALKWLLLWLAASVLGTIFIGNQAIERRRALFETDARIVHRLLSQQVVQLDAILATLALLQAEHVSTQATEERAPEQRLTALYPHILATQRRDRDTVWQDAALAQAETMSIQSRRATLANGDITSGRYRLVLAAQPLAYALTIDLRSMVPWTDWPMKSDKSAVRVVLEHEGKTFELQRGTASPAQREYGWRFDFSKQLAAHSQPFDVVATQAFAWYQLPWLLMLVWAMAVGVMTYLASLLLSQRIARRRAEDLLRLGQVARLNTLGELAAGIAHELNQPLTAVLANTQAAQRLLSEDPPEIATAQHAMTQAAAQAHRATQVVGRMRRLVEQPESVASSQALNLGDALSRALYLLEPECRRRDVDIQVLANTEVLVQADPVAVDQIIHNLLINALQAFDKSEMRRRRLLLTVSEQGIWGQLQVADNGNGIAPEVLPHLFEPFFSTREGGLGLGLSLCETLTQGMGGQLSARHRPEGGAIFTLSLPTAKNKLGQTLP